MLYVRVSKTQFSVLVREVCKKSKWKFKMAFAMKGGGHTGQVGDHTTCSQNKHVGKFLYFKLPKLPLQVKSRAIKDVTKYVLNTDVQFTDY